MASPTTLPDALAEIEELRGQVRDLLQLLGEEARPIAEVVSASPAMATDAHEFSEGLVPKQAGKDAAQHLLNLHQMIETVPDIIFTLDLQGTLVGWNKRLQIVTGFTPQELNGRPALSFVPEHEHAPTAAAIQRAFEDGYAELEGHLLTKDGRTIPYHWTGARLHDPQGRMIGLTGVGRDITDWKMMERQRQEQTERLRLAMEIADLATWDWDISTNKVIWSENYEQVKRLPPGIFDGTFEAYHQLLIPEDRPRLFADIQSALNGDSAYHTEHRIQPPGREVQWIEGNGAVFRDETGRPIRMVGTARNITERKLAEEERLKRETLLSLMLNTGPGCIKRVAPDGTLLHMNPAGLCLIELEKEEDAIGLSAFDIVAPEHRASFIEMHEAVIKGEVRTLQFQIQGFHGTRRWLESYAAPFVNPVTGNTEHLAVTHDITERKRAEQALADSEARFRTVVEGTSDWMWEVDAQGRYTYSSPRVRDLLGYEPEEVLGKTPFEFMLPEEAQRLGLLFDSIVEARSPFDRLENTQRHKDGHLVVLECRGVPILDAVGTLCGYRGFDRDVTKQKHAEKALRISEERYARATAVGKVGVWELDAVTGLYHADINLKALFGYGPDELSTDPYTWLGLVHPDDQSIALRAWERVMSGSTDEYHYELRMIRKDGTIIWTDVRGHAERDEHGHVQRLIGATVDITERKQADMALRISQMKLQQALEASNTGLWEWNTTTHEVTFSPEWKRQLGYEETELPDTFESWESRLHPDDRARAVTYAMRYRDNPIGEFRQDFRLRHKDGTYRWIDSQASFATEADGRRVRLLGSHTDITERKQAEAALLESEERFRTLVWNIPGAVYRCAADSEWTMSYLSHAIDEIVGYPAAEFIGNHTRSYASVIHPDDRRLVEEATGASLRERRPYVLVYRLIHANGEVRWVYEKGQGVFTPDDEVRFLDGAIFDITDRVEAEQALRQQHGLLTAIMDASIDHISVKDLNGRYIHMNRTGANALGMPIDEIIGWDDVALWGSESAASLRTGDRRVVESGETITTEESLTAEGKATVYLTTKAPYQDLEGRTIGVISVARDITERKQAEETLRRSEARLNEAQRLAHIGSWELDLMRNRLIWSDEIFRIFEIDQHQFGASYEAFLSLVHPDDRSAVDRAYTNSVRDRTPYEITHRLLMLDGRVKYVHEQCETLYDAQGEPQLSFGTVQDVTERMRLAEREAARLKQLQTLSELGLTLSGDPGEIFERVVSMIADLFKVRVVCLSEIVGDNLQFKAVYSNGEVWRNAGHCPLAVSPCAIVERDKDLRLFDRVMEQFPQASFLRDHQAVSFCGFPALDARGRVVAVTCLLDDKSRKYTAEEQALLRVFGQRIAIEIERARYLADQRRQAEALQRSHAFLRQVIDTTANFIFAKDRDGRFLLANKAVAEAYGTTVEGLIGKSDADFNPNPDEVAYFSQKDREVLDSLQERFIPEERITDAAGNIRWLQTVKRPLLDKSGQAVMVLGAATDITERKRIEESLRQRERDLQQAIEDRQRISEDLHDGILQSIYAIGLGLEACRPLIAGQPSKSATKLNAALQRTIGQLNHVLEEVRNFIAGLESQILDGQDFEAVLRTMVQTLAAHYPIPYKITIEQAAAQNLSTEQAYHVMNIAREALSNSLRHSGATRITVSLKALRRSVRLSVTDNGVGFNPVGARDVGHGLANMAARTQKIGGKLTLQSKPRQGAKVLVDIPRRLTDADT